MSLPPFYIQCLLNFKVRGRVARHGVNWRLQCVTLHCFGVAGAPTKEKRRLAGLDEWRPSGNWSDYIDYFQGAYDYHWHYMTRSLVVHFYQSCVTSHLTGFSASYFILLLSFSFLLAPCSFNFTNQATTTSCILVGCRRSACGTATSKLGSPARATRFGLTSWPKPWRSPTLLPWNTPPTTKRELRLWRRKSAISLALQTSSCSFIHFLYIHIYIFISNTQHLIAPYAKGLMKLLKWRQNSERPVFMAT